PVMPGPAWHLAPPRLLAPDAVLAHHLDQHAFAQPAVGDPQPPARECAPDRSENGATGKHEIGALAADAGIGGPFLVAHGEQPLDHPGHLIAAHPATVDAAPLVAAQIEMHARDGGHRARRAQQVNILDSTAAALARESLDEDRHL